MKLLTTAAEINAELLRMIEDCSSCQIAVAWASVGFGAFDRLMANCSKIERMIVGTHFYQTHPGFIEAFLNSENVRFVLNPDGVFHPKFYYFEIGDGSWECVVGSPNFTQGGVGLNDEMAVLISSNDLGSSAVLDQIRTTINRFWGRATGISTNELQAYREAWNRKRPLLKNLQGKFGDPTKENADDKGTNPLGVPILKMTWAEFFMKVKSEKQTNYGHSMAGRITLIQKIRQLFSEHIRFRDIDEVGRKQIAGLVIPTSQDAIDFRWFGSMTGAGKFWKAINNEVEKLSLALDLIPLHGHVSREAYMNYVDQFVQAFPEGRHGIGTATRLLAMKRPDTFVCLDAQNKRGLCKAFGIRQEIGYAEYWDSIIARIIEATWWCSAPPPNGVERDVWEARAAFLDSHFYEAPAKLKRG